MPRASSRGLACLNYCDSLHPDESVVTLRGLGRAYWHGYEATTKTGRTNPKLSVHANHSDETST